jgi:release factor glutamine methyltransferase
MAACQPMVTGSRLVQKGRGERAPAGVFSHTVGMSARQHVHEGVISRLAAAGCVAAVEEADELLSGAPDGATLERWIRRREEGEPLAWITGTQQFCGRALGVDPGVYVPRLQSEQLAFRAAELLGAHGRAVDLCTGAGAIAAHLMAAVPTASVVGVEIDLRAAVCARRNGVAALVADLDRPLRSKAFDVVTAVAPYVPTGELPLLPADVQRYEPRLSLDGGHDGLDLVRRIVVSAARVLRPGGWLLIELGGNQDRALGPTLDASGFDSIDPWSDEDDDLRGLAARCGSS